MVNWDWIALMVMIVMVVATFAGVVLLHPIARRLGALLEAMTEERQSVSDLERTLVRIGDSLDDMDRRLDTLEERQDFTEELVGRRASRKLESGAGEGASPGGGTGRAT